MPFKLLVLVLPLSLDTFAVSAAVGLAGLSRRERLRLSLVMAFFEGAMPLVGFAVGGLIGSAVGRAADYAAMALLAAVGLYILLEDAPEVDERLSPGLGVRAMVGLGLSVSLDELAIGFTVGLLRLPIGLVVVLIATQALLMSQLGVAVGARVGRSLAHRAGLAAGVVLIVLAAILAVLELTGRAG